MINNKKAYHDYFVEDTLECGLVLRGNEIKSIRNDRASIKESWVVVEKGTLIIRNMNISAWGTANRFDVDEVRDKVLLAHKLEIRRLQQSVAQQGYTLIPLKVYINEQQKCKILIGVCKGKHLYDKRQSEKDKQAKRDMERCK